jgi:TPR repeat protein
VLSQAGLVLGYLSFDGEGTRVDNQEAVRCFKLASQAGCKEAQQVLGWIFNTGQY